MTKTTKRTILYQNKITKLNIIGPKIEKTDKQKYLLSLPKEFLHQYCLYKGYKRTGNKDKLVETILKWERCSKELFTKPYEKIHNKIFMTNVSTDIEKKEKRDIKRIRGEIKRRLQAAGTFCNYDKWHFGKISNELYWYLFGNKGELSERRIKYKHKGIMRGERRTQNIFKLENVSTDLSAQHNFPKIKDYSYIFNGYKRREEPDQDEPASYEELGIEIQINPDVDEETDDDERRMRNGLEYSAN